MAHSAFAINTKVLVHWCNHFLHNHWKFSRHTHTQFICAYTLFLSTSFSIEKTLPKKSFLVERIRRFQRWLQTKINLVNWEIDIEMEEVINSVKPATVRCGRVTSATTTATTTTTITTKFKSNTFEGGMRNWTTVQKKNRKCLTKKKRKRKKIDPLSHDSCQNDTKMNGLLHNFSLYRMG